MKIAILGGSFNPIHNGHIEIARRVRKKLNPGKFFFVPSANNPLKNKINLLSFKKRYELIKKALAKYPFFCVSDLDNTGKNLSYSDDLIKRFQKKYPDDDIYFIIGEDNVEQLKLWHNYKWLLKNVTFLIITRTIKTKNEWINLDYINQLKFIDMPPVNISSTEIRDKVKAKESIKGLVPDEILSDIISLYKSID